MAVNRYSIARDELAGFALAAGETGFDKDIDELAWLGIREAFGQELAVVVVEGGEILFFREKKIAEFGGAICGRFAVNNSSNTLAEFFLAVAERWIFVVFGENSIELFWRDKGIHLEEAVEIVVGLVEPELIKIKDASFGAI